MAACDGQPTMKTNDALRVHEHDMSGSLGTEVGGDFPTLIKDHLDSDASKFSGRRIDRPFGSTVERMILEQHRIACAMTSGEQITQLIKTRVSARTKRMHRHHEQRSSWLAMRREKWPHFTARCTGRSVAHRITLERAKSTGDPSDPKRNAGG